MARVDFPQPELPTSPKASPSWMDSETPEPTGQSGARAIGYRDIGHFEQGWVRQHHS